MTAAAESRTAGTNASRGCTMLNVRLPSDTLTSLMMAFLPDQRSRRHLVLPTRVDVDFRAACVGDANEVIGLGAEVKFTTGFTGAR